MNDLSRQVRITEFISNELLGKRPVSSDDNLLADGMVSSLGMVRLVAFIDDTFGYSVPPEDFVIENFRTVRDLEAYLERSLAAGGAS